MGHSEISSARQDGAQGLEALFEVVLRRFADERSGKKPGLRDWVELAEAWRIAHALRESRGNRSAAARALGIGRRTLYSKMEKLGIAPSWGVRPESSGERDFGATVSPMNGSAGGK